MTKSGVGRGEFLGLLKGRGAAASSGQTLIVDDVNADSRY